MNVSVTARHFSAPQKLHDFATEIAQNFSKFHDGIMSVDIVLDDNHQEKIAEYIVKVKGERLVVKEISEVFEKSLSDGGDKMVRQLRKLKTKAESKLHEKVVL